MQLDFTPEQEDQLSRIANHQGKNAEELIRDVLLRMLDSNQRFLAAVQIGIDQANRGEFIEEQEMDVLVEQILRPA